MSAGALQRGNVVIVNFAPTNPAAQIRPAVIVQNNRDNARMGNTVVAQVTSTIRRAGQDTQLLSLIPIGRYLASVNHRW